MFNIKPRQKNMPLRQIENIVVAADEFEELAFDNNNVYERKSKQTENISKTNRYHLREDKKAAAVYDDNASLDEINKLFNNDDEFQNVTIRKQRNKKSLPNSLGSTQENDSLPVEQGEDRALKTSLQPDQIVIASKSINKSSILITKRVNPSTNFTLTNSDVNNVERLVISNDSAAVSGRAARKATDTNNKNMQKLTIFEDEVDSFELTDRNDDDKYESVDSLVRKPRNVVGAKKQHTTTPVKRLASLRPKKANENKENSCIYDFQRESDSDEFEFEEKSGKKSRLVKNKTKAPTTKKTSNKPKKISKKDLAAERQRQLEDEEIKIAYAEYEEIKNYPLIVE